MGIRDEPLRRIREIENAVIPLPDGGHLAARIWLPADAESSPVPALLEYLPYRKRDGTAVRDEPNHRYLAGHGYACLRVDLRGTGESDGLLRDEYLAQELEDADAAFAWIAAQRWCTGGVGMFGNSWGGFNALMVAARRPPALKAIITSCSTDDRYADDMHYAGGCLLTDMFDWGAAFLTFLARPPDPVLVGDGWRETWFERLEGLHNPVEDWLRHPWRDEFWRHGSVCENYDAVGCPVFAVGGWLDGYSNAVPRLLAGLSVPRLGLVGPWAHAYPHLGVPGPAFDFLGESVRWWDHWLKGIETGIMDEPMYRAWMPDGLPAMPFYETTEGRWVAERSWPSPRLRRRRLWLTDGRLEAEPRSAGPVQWASPQLTGAASGEWCPFGTAGRGPEFPGDQREDDDRSLVFDAAPLEERLEIFGAPIAHLVASVDRPSARLAVRLCDVAPDGTSTRVTYGVLDVSHRSGHERPEAITPGAPITFELRLNDVAYAFLPGHRLRLALSTTYWPMVWPSPEAVTLTLLPGGTLELPVRPPSSDDEGLVVPGPAKAGPPAATTPLQPGLWERTVDLDAMAGRVTISNVADAGLTRLDAIGMTIGSRAEDRYMIREGDPLSARCESRRTVRMERPGWQIRLEVSLAASSTGQAYRLMSDLEAFENGESVFRRGWDAEIARDRA